MFQELRNSGKSLMATILATVLSGCNVVPTSLTTSKPAQPTFAINADAAVAAIAQKQNRSYQDNGMSARQVREALKARGDKAYHLSAVGTTWTNALGAACSSAPAYAKADNANLVGPNPSTGDYIYVVLDNGQVQKIDPTTQTKTTVNLGTTFSKSAVVVSGDNRRIYLTSANGTFYVLDATNLSTIWSAKISSVGFTGMAPFMDYANAGGFPLGSDEHVLAMSTDGSYYDVNVKRSTLTGAYTVTVSAWTASNGTDQGAALAAWTTKVNIPYGVAVTPGATPIFWNGAAYFGTTTGTAYKVAANESAPTTTPVVSSWNLAQYTSAPGPNGMGCSASPALDYDNAFNVSAFFITCGDRLCWINPTTGNVYPSAALVVDKVPASAAQYQGALSSFPYTTTTVAYTDYDWDCVAKTNNVPPTRWGNGGASTITGTTSVCNTIKMDTIGGNMWNGQGTSPGRVASLNSSGGVVFQSNSSANVVNEIAFDNSGNCYAAHASSNLIAKYNNSGTLLTSYTYPSGNAWWPQPDSTGALWCVGSSGNVTKFSTTGSVLFTKTLASAFAIGVDSANNAYVTTSKSPATLTKYDSSGAVQTGFPVTIGNYGSYVAFEPTTGNIWVPNYLSNTISKVSPSGAVLGTYATPSGPWAVAFDLNGLPWLSCVGANSVVKLSLTGATMASYSLPSSPWEIAFDSAGACWCACQGGTYRIFDLGNLSDLFATDSFVTSGDGNDSLANLKFRITKGAFSGKPPVASTLKLTAATTPAIGPQETLNVVPVSNYLASTTTAWLGWQTVASINMDYNNRASVLNNTPIATLSNISPVKDSSQTFTLNSYFPVDALNTSDTSYAWHTYAFQAVGKVLSNAAHWYSNTTAPGASSQPTLSVSLATTALPSTSGIQSQPLVDSLNNKVYVMSCNCIFEVPYNTASPDDVRNPSKIYYNLTKAGRGGGPLNGTTYNYPDCDLSQNFYGDLFVVDQEISTGKMYANRFSTPFSATPSTDHLAAFFDASPGTGTIGQDIVWDYEKGSIYFTTSNNYLVRGSLY